MLDASILPRAGIVALGALEGRGEVQLLFFFFYYCALDRGKVSHFHSR